MKNIILIVILFLSSCSVDRLYTSGSYGSIKTYIAKPEYRDKDTTAVYISGSFGRGEHFQSGDFSNNMSSQNSSDDVKDDVKELFLLNIHKSFTRKNLNFYYGGGMTYGRYKFKSDFLDIVRANEKKEFYNFNTKIGVNFNLPTKRMDWRIIGLEFGYNYEFGPFQKTLQLIKNRKMSRVLVVNEKSVFSYNFNSEAVFKLKNNNVFGLGFFIGDVLNNPKELENRSSTFSGLFFSYKFKRYIFSFIREEGRRVNSSRIGLTYQLF